MGFILGLSRAGQRVYQFLLRGIKEGLPGTKIMEELRKHGLGYRLQDFYNDLRILRGEIKKWDTMKFVARNKVISEKLYTPVETPLKYKFTTVMRVEYINLDTGEKEEMYIGINHDNPMRREDLEEMALRIAQEQLEEYTGVTRGKILRAIPERGFRRG